MILNLSGFMFSGKSAVFDLLSGLKNVSCGHYHEEFDLFRVPGGLIDLSNSIENWSFMGIDGALKRFEKVSEKMCRKPRGFKRLYQVGWGYERRYPGITSATKDFVEKVAELKWNAEWPYDELEKGGLELFYRKLADRIPLFSRKDTTIRMCNKSNFKVEVDLLIKKIFNVEKESETNVKEINLIVNAFDPTNPYVGLNLSGCLRNIVVDRDIRDIYADSVSYSEGFNDNVAMFSKITGAFDVEIFIKRQKLLRQKMFYLNDETASRNHVIYFDDLVLNFDQTKLQLLKFLGLDSNTTFEDSSFRVENSRKNVGKWQALDSKFDKAIRRIEEELPDLCIQTKYR